MHLSLWKCWIVLLVGLHVLQVQSCDLIKHYQNDNKECCDMCGPGTRMPAIVNCKEPACVPCKDNEYQGSYTKDTKCSLHPFCDPNLNKVSTYPIKKDHISLCRCMEGYHCDNEQCATCVLNSKCPPGSKVSQHATQKTDTKCDACPSGTFSSTFSLESSCQPWRKCENGEPQQQGNTTADSICKVVENTSHIGVAIAVPIVLVALVIVGVYCLRDKCDVPCTQNVLGAWTRKLQKEKGQEQFEPLKNKEDIEAVLIEQTPRQAEENEVKEEETDRSPVQEGDSSSDNHIDTEVRSEGGQIIQQEQGKAHILSQTESCPSTASGATECEC